MYEGRDKTTSAKVILLETEKVSVGLAKRYKSVTRLKLLKNNRKTNAKMRQLQTNDARPDQRLYYAPRELHFLDRQQGRAQLNVYVGRDTARDDALEGHYPKEHQQEDANTNGDTQTNTTSGRQLAEQQVDMQTELGMFGFIEFVNPHHKDQRSNQTLIQVMVEKRVSGGQIGCLGQVQG
ncbi:hypothetical protein R1sor_023025 [Riccia sorocarpa]|uniref:Uncharacterized protein n=1 Tax=Riccia sorocarpa TaxID=122646 RepID=A0ABD3GNQ7_9MARC